MTVSRRRVLGALAGLAALPLASCHVLPVVFQPPPTVIPARPVRLAGIMSQNVTVADQANYRHQYQQVVDTVAGQGVAIDKTITWIPGTPAGQSGYAAGMSTFQNIETAYIGSAAGGTPSPDLLMLAGDPSRIYTPWLLGQLVGGPLVRAIDSQVRSDRATDQQDYYPQALNTCRIAGKLYGLPVAVEPYLLLSDLNLFQAAGVQSPPTWDWAHMLDAATRLTKPPGQYAFAPTNFPTPELFLWQHGAAVLSADGQHCTLDDLAAIEAATFYGDLFTRYKVVAPAGKDAFEWPTKPNGQMTYNGARIAMLMTSVGENLPKSLQFGEPFHDSARATTMVVNDVLVMTVRAADPAQAYPVMAALANELQKQSFLPARRRLAKAVQAPRNVTQPEFTAVLKAAEYARASQLDPAITAAFYNNLLTPLQQGTKKAADACKEAADAINAILQGRSATPAPV